MNVPQTRKVLLSTIFGRTIQLAQELKPQKVKAFLQDKTFKVSELDTLINFLQTLKESFPKEKQQAFAEIFYLEYKKFSLFETSPSSGITHIQDRIYQRQAKSLLKAQDAKLFKQQLVLSPTCELAEISETQSAYLLRLSPYGTDELSISTFCHLVLQQFQNATTIVETITTISTMYNAQTKEDTDLVKEKVIAQIKEAIQYGILIAQA